MRNSNGPRPPKNPPLHHISTCVLGTGFVQRCILSEMRGSLAGCHAPVPVPASPCLSNSLDCLPRISQVAGRQIRIQRCHGIGNILLKALAEKGVAQQAIQLLCVEASADSSRDAIQYKSTCRKKTTKANLSPMSSSRRTNLFSPVPLQIHSFRLHLTTPENSWYGG